MLGRTSILLALSLLLACQRSADEKRKQAGATETPGGRAAVACDGKTFAPCKASCDAGNQDHCMDLAGLYRLGRGGASKDFAESMRLYQKG